MFEALIKKIFKAKMLKFLRQPLIDIRDMIFSSNMIPVAILNIFKGKSGLEVGGASWLWRTHVPIYRTAKKIDNVLLSKNTIWQNYEGKKFNYFFLKQGNLYISDESYSTFSDEVYDFVIARDVLEHIANPIKTLINWRRLIKVGGYLVVAVPNKIYSLDYARPFTSFVHIVNDYINNVGEDDKTHYAESKDLVHDHKLPQYSSREEWAKLLDDNYHSRIMHHHVFSHELICRVVSESGFRILYSHDNVSGDILVIAQKYNDAILYLKPNLNDIINYENNSLRNH